MPKSANDSQNADPDSDTEVSFNTAARVCEGISPSTPLQVCFSLTRRTQLELLDSLSLEQADRELENVLFLCADSPLAKKLDLTANLETKINTLKKLYDCQFKSTQHSVSPPPSSSPLDSDSNEYDELRNSINALSCTVNKLESDNTDAHNQLAETLSTVKTAVLTCETPLPEHELHLSPGQNVEPYEQLEHNIDGFDVVKLDESTEWTHTFGNRKCSYYSDTHDYDYSGTHHPKRAYSTNPYLNLIIAEYVKKYPHSKWNSAMLVRYSDGQDGIPYHPDNEWCIVPGSDITFFALGDSRTIHYRSSTGELRTAQLLLEPGAVTVMTRDSQDYWDHAILPEHCKGLRISITFRLMRDNQSILPQPVAQPYRLLVLTDSRNKDFDPAIFKNNITCIKKTLYTLENIESFSHEIDNSDIVLISVGVNDIVRNSTNPGVVHNKFRDFLQKFRNTKFLFMTVCPISMRADKLNTYNPDIDLLNYYIFQLSLRTSNLYVFDHLRWSMSHLKQDGVHLTATGKVSYTKCWLMTVLLFLGYRKGSLPIRRHYQDMLTNYRFRMGNSRWDSETFRG